MDTIYHYEVKVNRGSYGKETDSTKMHRELSNILL